MKERVFVVTNRLGLHARPASLFVQAGAKYRCSVKVTKLNGDEFEVNGKSVMGLMMLAAANGEKVKVVVDGPDEERALVEIEGLFQRKFDEE
ncbi:MAG TPA: HPr family phosphocarrier protein [Elusimicrobiota bacterium]|jgi:phosphocarrier protein|nr:HPr family phosphocarrier protein [Elusimicrobiota bacterium]